MKFSIPKLVIMVVYKTKDDWRGFCAPYDVSCNAPTKEKAMKAIEGLVDLYEEGLKKYNYPIHLSNKKLTSKDDEKVLKIVLKTIIQKEGERMKEAFLKYQLEQEKKNFRVAGKSFSGSYYMPSYLTT